MRRLLLLILLGVLALPSTSLPAASELRAGGSAGPPLARCATGLMPKCLRSLSDAATTLTRPRKDSVLAWPLATLARAEQSAAARGKTITAENIDTLPKSLRDLVAADLMHIDASGRVQVFVEVSSSAGVVAPALEAAGGRVERMAEAQRLVQAWVPIGAIAALRGVPGVTHVRLPDYGRPQIGSVTSEGDTLLSAATTRSMFGVDGAGVRVGVVSDGVEGLAASQASGDLPVVNTATCDVGPGSPTLAGAGAEGTATLEIVHDLAPGAELWFGHAGFGFDGTILDFMAAVNCLAQNVDVVVDDVGFFNAGPYDGTSSVSQNASQALNNPTNRIRGYYNAVGNEALGHYQSGFVNSGVVITDEVGTPIWDLHRFQGNLFTSDAGLGLPCEAGGSVFCGDSVLLVPGGVLVVLLQWNDPWGASANDYDLLLLDESSETLFLVSGNEQNGNDDPVEAFGWVNDTASPQWLDTIIGRFSGAPRAFDMFVLCVGCVPLPDGLFGQPLHNFNTACSSVPNNSDAGGGVVGLGAIDAADPGTNTIEPYSSCGPTDDGRIKPNAAAVDGVSVTGNGGFGSPFFGTSAAGPHAAAIAALLLDCNPNLTRAQLRSALLNTAVDLGPAGVDVQYGSGRLNTVNAANSVTCGPPPTPTVTPTPTQTPTVTPTPTITPTPTPKDPALRAEP